jgi:hypothetical protein
MGCAQRSIAVAAVVVVATGCLGIGGESEYAKYQHREEAGEQIDALVATIPQYPDARLADRHDSATTYHLAVDEAIEAEPYSSTLGYIVPADAGGAGVMLHFRRVLPARGWHCEFKPRVRGELRHISCRRGRATLDAVISDPGHYELTVQASDARPPIEVIDGD